ncbi:hypothetical protein M0R04_03090 [Candidatus Dojkabacteria bacterium]|jgi:hypothetical protein|nr:hypothetical protein [Candidatus Dojkabacteria bacterium]
MSKPVINSETLERLSGACKRLVKSAVLSFHNLIGSEDIFTDPFERKYLVFRNRDDGWILLEPKLSVFNIEGSFPVYGFKFDEKGIIEYIALSEFSTVDSGLMESQVILSLDEISPKIKRKVIWGTNETEISSPVLNSSLSVDPITSEVSFLQYNLRLPKVEGGLALGNPYEGFFDKEKLGSILYSETKRSKDAKESVHSAFLLTPEEIPFPFYFLKNNPSLKEDKIREILGRGENSGIVDVFPLLREEEVSDLEKLNLITWQKLAVPLINAASVHNEKITKELA